MANEVELKLRIRAADIPRLKQHPALTGNLLEAPVTRKLTSIYYDTPDLALLDAGLSLRVRRMAGGWFQAVKAAGHSLAGLHQRMEWEDIIAHGAPDFSKIVDPALTRVFDDAALRRTLLPIFTTDVHRTEWQLQTPDGSHVEVALDLGKLIAGGAREPIREIELELKDGHPASLFRLALALMEAMPLWLENVSKAQRGYVHYRPQPPSVVRARAAELKASMTPAEAGRAIAWTCLAQLQGNHEVVMLAEDPEGVHQMRVALRRLRSAMTVFGEVFAPPAALEDEWRWLADGLGQARDLDVLLTETLPQATAQHAHPGFTRLHTQALKARRHAYGALHEALRSQRYQRLLLQTGIWLETLHEAADGGLKKFARTILQRRHRQLARYGSRLSSLPPHKRHAARIAAKKLRYSAEFFSCLFPGRKNRDYLRHLTDLQDILGALNDIAVTEHLVDSLVGERPGRTLSDAHAAIAEWNSQRAEQPLSAMEAAWHRFSRTAPFWD